jgi:leukotriene-A4 hydrolase
MRILTALIFSAIWLFMPACKQSTADVKSSGGIQIPAPDSVDHHSYAKPDEARVDHLQLDLRVDFKEEILEGVASYTIVHNNAREIIFDTKDLTIIEVRIGQEGEPHSFKMGSADDLMGQSLTIPLKPETDIVTIHYKTQPTSEALQWLSPEQSRQKTPFLYTQSQAMLARTWLPCQDSPGIRFTYDARVRVPEGLMAVMSAANPTMVSNTGDYFFTMEQPIPAYLMAMAVGNLEYRPYGRMAGIYAQPDVLLSAAWEFEDTEKMIEVASALFGPYRWERFDILVLPPSFPYGGMENPRLTFVTPTVIAGDRSLTALIAHELAHSWSGNLVTNATWNDFWLNEGFTVYLERRIMEMVYSSAWSRMEEELGYQDLLKTLKEKGQDHSDTRLKGNLDNRNPDEGISSIAYEKGYLFLRTMEEMYGRNAVDNILNAWFRKKAFESATTEEFVTFLKGILMDGGSGIGVDEWVYGTGLPSNAFKSRSEQFAQLDEVLKKLESDKNVAGIDTTGWSALEWMYFLRQLPENADLAALEQRFNLSASGNAEYKAIWFEQCLQKGFIQPIQKPLTEFLTQVGRRKFLTPLYKGMIQAKQLDTAWDIYAKARPGYHSISRKAIDEIFADNGKKIS